MIAKITIFELRQTLNNWFFSKINIINEMQEGGALKKCLNFEPD